jgi:hypothetical protein
VEEGGGGEVVGSVRFGWRWFGSHSPAGGNGNNSSSECECRGSNVNDRAR